jgi:hypothetical protein
MSLIKARSTSINLTSDPDTLGMATGTTAQRNPNAIEGEVRFNTDLQQLEYFDGFFWNQTSLVSGNVSFEYLVVGGGGTGGGWGGGGGAGGFLTGTFTPNSGTIYSITVGLGGVAIDYYVSPTGYKLGVSGSASSISGTGLTTITADGGGGGGNYDANNGLSGGSGGGGASRNTSSSVASGGAATGNGLGFAGGNTSSTGSYYPGAGGGGGAGSAGSNGGGDQGGTGGDGLQSSITGVSKYYAGGGGGFSSRTGLDPGAAGGQGGGGAGGRYQNSSASIVPRSGTDGTDGLGGGGGGSYSAIYSNVSYPVGNGGRGTVIIKSNVALTTTGTYNLNPDGAVAGFFIYEFTSNGTITF